MTNHDASRSVFRPVRILAAGAALLLGALLLAGPASADDEPINPCSSLINVSAMAADAQVNDIGLNSADLQSGDIGALRDDANTNVGFSDGERRPFFFVLVSPAGVPFFGASLFGAPPCF